MEIPDLLFATLSNLSLFTMSTRLRMKLQIGEEMTQNSAPDDRCHLNAKFTTLSGSRLRTKSLKSRTSLATKDTFAQPAVFFSS